MSYMAYTAYTSRLRSITFFLGPSVADPAYLVPAVEVFRHEKKQVWYRGWRAKLAVKLVNWLIPACRDNSTGRVLDL